MTDAKYHREYYHRKPEEWKKRKYALQVKRRIKNQAEIDNYKAAMGCSVCSESGSICLDFHHEDGDKEFVISDAVRGGWSTKRIFSEIEKCVVLCANCHRKAHYKQQVQIQPPRP